MRKKAEFKLCFYNLLAVWPLVFQIFVYISVSKVKSDCILTKFLWSFNKIIYTKHSEISAVTENIP